MNSGSSRIVSMTKPIKTMKTSHTLIAATAATFAILATPMLRAEDPKAPAKETKTEVKKDAAKPYPLDTCIVSGEKLGEMGKPVVFVYQGQEIKLCCKSCKPKFDKEPAKYLKKLEGK